MRAPWCWARSSMAQRQSTVREFVITRVFDAPRELVWKAFTEPARMKAWWGPKGFTVLHSKMDLRPGGIYHYGMRAPDGSEMWGKMAYREIAPPERIVWVNSFSDKEGNVARHHLHMAWPLEVLSTLTLETQGSGTKLTIRGLPPNASAAERKTFDENGASMQQGWTGTLDQLDAYLAKAR